MSTIEELAARQSQDIARRKAENRRLVAERLPVVSELFAQLEAAGMSPKMVKLKWFDKGE